MPQQESLLQQWHIYTKNLTSPQSYVDFSFYYLISTTLGRRIWMETSSPKDSHALFPNIYVFLVGPAGVGKGIVIKPTVELLRYFGTVKGEKGMEVVERGKLIPSARSSDSEEVMAERALFPSLPESTTYAQVVRAMATDCAAFHPVVDGEGKIVEMYLHSAGHIALEELSSLIKKNNDEIVRFLLAAYDAGDYRHHTKQHGKDGIKRCCLSMLAGTTPSYMEEIFTERLVGEGFTARCFYIYEFMERRRAWRIGGLDTEQIEAKRKLLDHIKLLSKVYGEVRLSPTAEEFARNWWEQEEIKADTRINSNPKLIPYYVRKNIHSRKMAMILHFASFNPMFPEWEINVETFQNALKVLESIERRMHYALVFGRRNPLAAIGDKILDFLKRKKTMVSRQQLADEFWNDLRDNELEECIRYLVSADKIFNSNNKYGLMMFRDTGLYMADGSARKVELTKAELEPENLPARCPKCAKGIMENKQCKECGFTL